MGAKPENRIAFLDGLRGIAILGVLATHTFYLGLPSEGNPYFSRSGLFFAAMGQRGVQFFFLLSSFTLFFTLLRRFDTEDFPRLNFYVRRWFRIIPLYFAVILYYGCVLGPIEPKRLFLNLSFLFGFVRYEPVEYFQPQWTLFVEESFYLIFPWIFPFLRSRRNALWFVLSSWLIGFAWTRGATFFGVTQENYFVANFPLNHGYTFAMGVLLFHLWSDGEFKKFLDRNHRVLYVLTGIFGLQVFLRGHDVALLFCTLLFLCAIPTQGLFAKVVRNPWLQKFGVCCYSIYLLHMFLFIPLEPLRNFLFDNLNLSAMPPEVQWIFWFPVMSLVNLTVCYPIYFLVEKPCIALGKKLLGRWERPKVSEHVSDLAA